MSCERIATSMMWVWWGREWGEEVVCGEVRVCGEGCDEVMVCGEVRGCGGV